MNKPVLAAAVAAAVLAAPAAAQAHVTLNPREVTAGSFTVMNVRVPNERDDAGTVKVDVRFPDGFSSVLYKKVPGWKVKVVMEKLDQPVEREGGLRVTEQVARPARSSRSRPTRPTATASACAGAARRRPSTPLRG